MLVLPVVDACIYGGVVVRAPPVIRCVHILRLVVVEVPPIVYHDVVITDIISCASVSQVETSLFVESHPVADDGIVA